MATPPAQHTIAILQVAQIVEGARRRGHDVAALLRRAGIAPAQRATVADRERVRQCLAQLEAAFAGDDLDRQVDTDLAFHQAIAEASHNVIVGHLTASLLRLMRDNLRRNLSELMQVPAAREQLLDQHRAVWHAIEQGKAGQALEAAADHIGYVRQNLARMLRSDARLKP